MQKLSLSITRRQATDAEISNHLTIHFPEFQACLDEPTAWISVVYEYTSDTSGWQNVGGGEAVSSMWRFWKDGHDLQHLRTLATKPRKAVPAPVATTVNQFAALQIEDDQSSNDSAEADDAPVPVGSASDMWSFMFVKPDIESWEEASITDRGSVSDTETDASDNFTRPGQHDSNTTRQTSISDAVQDGESFCSFFGFGTLPAIPQTDRDLDVLLADGDIWSFSMEERRRVAEFITAQAKADVDEESLALFEMLTRKHAEARRAHEEAVANVSIAIAAGQNELTGQRRVSMMQKVKLLGSTTTGEPLFTFRKSHS